MCVIIRQKHYNTCYSNFKGGCFEDQIAYTSHKGFKKFRERYKQGSEKAAHYNVCDGSASGHCAGHSF